MSNFINDDIVIDFKIPDLIQEMIDYAIEGDKKNDYGAYQPYADMIDVMAKNFCAEGKLTQKQWDTLVMKYPE